MKRSVSAALWAVAIAGLLAAHGCSDVGGSSVVPGSDAGGGADVGPGTLEDAPIGTSDSAPGPGVDASLIDSTIPSGGVDSGLDSSSGFDVVVPADTGAQDTGGQDTATQDTGVADTGSPDSTVLDSGTPDTGGANDSGHDAAPPDAGTDAGHDSGPADAGTEAGSDAADAGGVLVPCTSAGQTHCVQCQDNNGALSTFPNAGMFCTPTEAALVQHDIAAGLATAPGPDPAGSCYTCAAEQACLDDSKFADKGHECEDLSGSTSQGECAATLACILGSACVGGSVGVVSTCYCGTAPVSGSCANAGSGNAANGACKTQEAAGLGFAANDGLDILKNFTSTTLPSGVANNIFQCALSNSCTACLQ